MVQINYWDSWKQAREKINDILDIAENSIPSIWENWHWYLWRNDTWINATWPKWEQGIQGEQGIQWPKGEKWDKWEQWVHCSAECDNRSEQRDHSSSESDYRNEPAACCTGIYTR